MLESNSELTAAEVRRQCLDYVVILDKIFSTPLWHFMGGRFVEVACDCGFLMKRRVEAVKAETTFECGECGRIFDVVSVDESRVGLHLRVARWNCIDCKIENTFGSHELEEGKAINCQHCGASRTIGKAWVFS